MVAVLGHIHSAARELKYTKNSIHKCYNQCYSFQTVDTLQQTKIW